MKQLAFDFNEGIVKIVKNYWAEAFHVQDLEGFTVATAEQPHMFPTAEKARDWALTRGFEVWNREYSKKE